MLLPPLQTLSVCALVCSLLLLPFAAEGQTKRDAKRKPPLRVARSSDVVDSACRYSSLWGVAGEKWISAGRLPDFSYAGYQAGEREIPNPKARWDLKRHFGAKGDGITDDSAALLKAIDKIKSGVLFIPKGKYVIASRIDIARGDLIIRGAGKGQTILYFPKSLTDLFGNAAGPNQTSQWSFWPGLINIKGRDPINEQTRIARVTAESKRGDSILEVSEPVKTAKGEWIRLVESDPPKPEQGAGSLIRHLYGDLMPPGEGLVGTAHVVRFLSRIKSTSGNQIQLERPLPYDVRIEWKPEIHRFVPTVTGFGIERLSIHFPWSPYKAHFREKGFNGIFFSSVSQCWVSDIEIQNSDFALDFNSTNFCTARNVSLSTSANRAVEAEARDTNGHHGIDVSHGTENLVTNFDIRARLVHDISVEWYALHTVFSNGRGVDLNMDHHREANYSSLFSNIDCGACTRPFNSGGSGNRGAHSGAYSTYWNIRGTNTSSAIALPPNNFGPALNFIGLGEVKNPQSPYEWYIEPGAAARLCPAELHHTMQAARLRRSKRYR